MPNRRRGEVALQLGDTRYTLCLTLGALAELEDAFGVQDLMALTERFGTGRLSSRDLLTLLGVALHEGIEPVAAALADLLVMTFGGGEAAPNPPSSQEAGASHVPSPGMTR